MTTNKNYALVTGATAGIGYELAKLLANDGYNLILVARDEAELTARGKEFEALGRDVVTISADLFVKENAFELCQRVQELDLTVDVLINDAGQGQYGLFKDTDIDRELAIIDLNIGSLVILTKHFLQPMLSRGSGRILNLASIASEVPGPWQSVYHGTKAFVLSFSEAIHEELKETGVTVTALLPGPTDTDFFNKAEMQDSRIVQDESMMADPAKVAKDGYDAMMSGKDKVISGFRNKVQVGMSHVLPDSTVAHTMNEQQKPVDDEDGK